MAQHFTPLQSLVFASTEVWADESMYFRHNDKVRTDFVAKKIYLDKHGKLFSDTFYNGLSVGVWKKFCSIDTLQFRLEAEGSFTIKFGLHRFEQHLRWLSQETFSANTNESVIIDLPFWNQLEDGIIFFQIEALTDNAVIQNGGYYTDTPPLHDVTLGLVITHFNRQAYVVPAIKRIVNGLLSSPQYKNKITLTIVDNSKNIGLEESEGFKIIPNRNLGGAGGFTRGLMDLEDEKIYTHCLFMDDDASCEIESIRRTYALLQYTHKEKFAVAGSLLRELKPYHLFEKGAHFDGLCRPLKSGLDMRHVHDLVNAEQNYKKPHYGAWWFFAFPLKEVQHYAFPFFVRGDDILFSLMNKFNICTMNGIAAFGDDFALKSGPLTTYLDFRYHLLQIIFTEESTLKAIKIAARFYLGLVFTHHYASAKSSIFALKHVSQGPDFFIHNLDTSEIRAEIASFSPSEKMSPITRDDYNLVTVDYTVESKIRTLIRFITLNGFLLPGIFLKNATVFQEKGFRGKLRDVFRFKKVLYEYTPLGTGYTTDYNRSLFMKLNVSFMVSLVFFLWRLPALRRMYLNSLDDMTSRNFWENVYKDQ